MMYSGSKGRLKFSFAGSLIFHIFLVILLAFAGIFSANKVDNKIVEVAIFGGGGGGGGLKPNEVAADGKVQAAEQAVKQTELGNIVDQITEKYEQNYRSASYDSINNNVQQSSSSAGANAAENTGTGSGYGSGQGAGAGSGSGVGQGSGDGAGMGAGTGNITETPSVPPRLVSHRELVYPSTARRAGIEGTTMLRLLIGADGSVEEVLVTTSSGSEDLDDAAVSACYKWEFTAAKNGIGQSIRCYTYVPIAFRLR